MTKDVAIKVEKLTKEFKLPHERYTTAKQRFVNIVRRSKAENLKALDKVSFEVKKGEFFGIIGANGSGKSTLLKILAEIYLPSAGFVEVEGKLSPFIELGVGFNPELTARENVFLNGAILGLSRKETEGKFDEIIKFAELEQFVDQKLKNFSSGMQVRLAFSIAIQVQPEILLIDEVLAVGDAAFQQKCFDVFRRLKREGKTIVFVSHALNVVEEFCDRVLVLKKGKKSYLGSTSKGTIHYLRQEIEDQPAEKTSSFGSKSSDIQVEKIEFLNSKRESKKIFGTGDDITIRIFFKVKKKINSPVFGLAIHKEDRSHITGPNTKTSKFFTKSISSNGFLDYDIKSTPLLAGTYYVTVGIFDKDVTFSYDFVEESVSFKIAPNLENQFGVVTLNGEWKLNDPK